MSAALPVGLMGVLGPAFPCSHPPAAVRWLVSSPGIRSLGRDRQASELCAGQACCVPLGWDCLLPLLFESTGVDSSVCTISSGCDMFWCDTV